MSNAWYVRSIFCIITDPEPLQAPTQPPTPPPPRSTNYRPPSVEAVVADEEHPQRPPIPAKTSHGARGVEPSHRGLIEVPLANRDKRLPKIYRLKHAHQQLKDVRGVKQVYVYFEDTDAGAMKKRYDEYEDMGFPDGTQEGVRGAGMSLPLYASLRRGWGIPSNATSFGMLFPASTLHVRRNAP